MKRIFCFHKSNSGEIARSRLKLVLISDQAGCCPSLIEGFRDDIIGVLSRYAEFDSSKVDICLTRAECAGIGESMPTLLAKVPIRQFTNMRNE